MPVDNSQTERLRRLRSQIQTVRNAECAACPELGPQGPTNHSTWLSRRFGQMAYRRQNAAGAIVEESCCNEQPKPIITECKLNAISYVPVYDLSSSFCRPNKTYDTFTVTAVFSCDASDIILNEVCIDQCVPFNIPMKDLSNCTINGNTVIVTFDKNTLSFLRLTCTSPIDSTVRITVTLQNKTLTFPLVIEGVPNGNINKTIKCGESGSLDVSSGYNLINSSKSNILVTLSDGSLNIDIIITAGSYYLIPNGAISYTVAPCSQIVVDVSCGAPPVTYPSPQTITVVSEQKLRILINNTTNTFLNRNTPVTFNKVTSYSVAPCNEIILSCPPGLFPIINPGKYYFSNSSTSTITLNIGSNSGPTIVTIGPLSVTPLQYDVVKFGYTCS